MAEIIDDISIDYEEDGKVIIKQLAKEVLTRGSWTTIMFLYQQLDKKNNVFSDPKVSIRRYQKVRGEYRKRSQFNISTTKQAQQIIGILEKWFPADGAMPQGVEIEKAPIMTDGSEVAPEPTEASEAAPETDTEAPEVTPETDDVPPVEEEEKSE